MGESSRDVIRFGQFEVDVQQAELRSHGVRLRIQEQPLRILLALLDTPGEVVTRDELIKKVWPSNTFVDFEHSLNAAINRLRHILDDAAERPRYIETVPKRGYRWLCQIQRQSNGETTPNALMTGYKLTRSFDDFGSLSAEPVIAVLPFADISPTRDSNYFCDGLAEEITSGLTRVSGLRVIGRGSTSLFRHRTLALRDIAGSLSASFVLDGSFRQLDRRIRITAQLVRASDQTCLWSERYDRYLVDLFQVQEDIARAIVDTLQLRISAVPLIKQYTRRDDAHLFYLKGVFYSHAWTADAFEQICSYMRRVIEIEPGHAPAWVELAGLYFGQVMAGVQASKALPLAVDAAYKAVAADPSFAQARAVLGAMKGLGEHDWCGAISEFDLAQNPAPPELRYYHALVLTALGHTEEAISELRQSLESDPFSVLVNMHLCRLCTVVGNYHAAIRYGERAIEVGPQHFPGFGRLGEACVYAGDLERGIALLKQSRSSAPAEGWYTAALAAAYRRAGRLAEAAHVWSEVEQKSHRQYVPFAVRAFTAAAVGYIDEAFGLLQRAVEDRDGILMFLTTERTIEAIREDSRYRDVLASMNLIGRVQSAIRK